MSDKMYLDPNQDNLDSSIGKEEDASRKTEDLFNEDSKNPIQVSNQITSSEHHRCLTITSEGLKHKGKHETADLDLNKQMLFTSTKQRQDMHFIVAEEPSNEAESSIPSSLPTSLIRHTRDEPHHISSLPENKNETLELTSNAEDHVQTSISFNVCDDAHAVAGPPHFICDKCEKCFFTKYELDRHYAMHSGHKSFSCQICELKFSFECNLERHMQTHLVQKEHKCDRCHKAYNRKGNLARHYKIHTGEKPYTCEKCKKIFSGVSHFTRHRKSCNSSSEAN